MNSDSRNGSGRIRTGCGSHNTGTVKDVFTADETIALLQRFDNEENDQPWLTVCSFLNPHDIALAGVFVLAQELHYDTGEIPHIDKAPTHKEDLSTRATVSAELRRYVGEASRTATVDRGQPEVILPDAARG